MKLPRLPRVWPFWGRLEDLLKFDTGISGTALVSECFNSPTTLLFKQIPNEDARDGSRQIAAIVTSQCGQSHANSHETECAQSACSFGTADAHFAQSAGFDRGVLKEPLVTLSSMRTPHSGNAHSHKEKCFHLFDAEDVNALCFADCVTP